MARRATVADYNAKDRAVEFSVDIYFNGISAAPLHCTRENHLVDCSVLLEACADSDTFVGVPSANEISFQLLGAGGIFNPANPNSPYAGRIRAGVQINAYCRPIAMDRDARATHAELHSYTHEFLSTHTHAEVEMLGSVDEEFLWDPLGVYYVTAWETDITGVTADVTACDAMYYLMNDNSTDLLVQRNYSYQDLCTDFFDANNITVIIRGDLSELLDFAYIDESNVNFLANFSIGALAYIYCDVNGVINVLDIDNNGPVDFTITDSDQIVTVTSRQSAMLTYDGLELTYYKMQLTDNTELLNNKEQTALPGSNRFYNQIFSKIPVYAISNSTICAKNPCSLNSIESNATSVSYNINNDTSTALSFDFQVFGYAVESIAVVLSDNNPNTLKLDNKYIQNDNYANRFKVLIQRYLGLDIPVLELEVRGNPLITIGSKVHVQSTFYNLNFSGILIRQEMRYDGGLSGTMTLLNADIVRQ